jgi:hypothetical protein
MADPIEQPQTEFILELLDCLANSGLGCEHNLGGLRETALPDNFDEGAQRSELHGDSISGFSSSSC